MRRLREFTLNVSVILKLTVFKVSNSRRSSPSRVSSLSSTPRSFLPTSKMGRLSSRLNLRRETSRRRWVAICNLVYLLLNWLLQFDADVVLVAVGRRPYTEGLNLEAIGVEKDNKGRIVIDDQFNTSVKNIKCIGDVTFGPMLAHKAEEEGEYPL